MAQALKLFFSFLPSWAQVCCLAMIAILVVVLVVKIIALVLDALPFV